MDMVVSSLQFLGLIHLFYIITSHIPNYRQIVWLVVTCLQILNMVLHWKPHRSCIGLYQIASHWPVSHWPVCRPVWLWDWSLNLMFNRICFSSVALCRQSLNKNFLPLLQQLNFYKYWSHVFMLSVISFKVDDKALHLTDKFLEYESAALSQSDPLLTCH